MKNLYLLLILISTSLLSQNSEMGPEIKYSDEKFFDKAVGYDKTGFYCLRFNTEGKGRNYFLMCYNRATLEQTKSIPLGMRFTQYDRDNYSIKPGIPVKLILTSFVKDGKYIEYSQVFYEEKGLLQLVLNVFNTTSGEQTQTDKILGETSCSVAGMYIDKFVVVPNYDSTKVLLVLQTLENTNPVANCQLINLENSSKIWEKKITGIGASGIVSTCHQVDENENLYYFFLQRNDSKVITNTGIATILKNESQPKVLAEKLATSGSVYCPSMTYIKEDNAVYCFYNTSNELKAGFYYAKIKNGKLEFSDNYSFPDKVMGKLFCPTSGNQKERNSFTPVKFFKINGSYFLTSHIELYYTIEGRRSRWAENINVCKLSTSGTIEWHSVLPYDGSHNLVPNIDHNDITDISIFKRDDKLSFVFIDHPKNGKANPDPNNFDVCKIKGIGTYANTNVLMLSVDNTGLIYSKNLFLNEDTWLIPGSPALKNSDDNLIIRGKKGKTEFFKVVK